MFVADPSTPIATVAKRAGVGMSALYRRYASKEGLIRRLCADGLDDYIAAAEAAVSDPGTPGTPLPSSSTAIVDANMHSMTLRLAGTFTVRRAVSPSRAGAAAQRAAARAGAAGGRGPS